MIVKIHCVLLYSYKDYARPHVRSSEICPELHYSRAATSWSRETVFASLLLRYGGWAASIFVL